MSQAYETVGFPGVAIVQAVDTINGYVLVRLKPASFYQPGFDQTINVSEDKTYSNADFDALETGLSRTATKIMRQTYDAQRNIWTNNGRDT